MRNYILSNLNLCVDTYDVAATEAEAWLDDVVVSALSSNSWITGGSTYNKLLANVCFFFLQFRKHSGL